MEIIGKPWKHSETTSENIWTLIYGTTWKKNRKEGASFTQKWIDTDSQWIAKHGISGFDREHHQAF